MIPVLAPITQGIEIVPVPVWQQLGVVLVFALLGYIALRIFKDIVVGIARDYQKAILSEREHNSVERAQDREEIKAMLAKFDDMVKEFQRISSSVEKMIEEFKDHDKMERSEIQDIRDFVARNKPKE